jgi:hypothetical protein
VPHRADGVDPSTICCDLRGASSSEMILENPPDRAGWHLDTMEARILFLAGVPETG